MEGSAARGRKAVAVESPSVNPAGQPGPGLAGLEAADREPLLRRWLSLVVERSTIDELGARPLGERLADFELLLEAAGSAEGSKPAGGGEPTGEEGLLRRLDAEVGGGRPFALALLRWRQPEPEQDEGAPRREADEAGPPPHGTGVGWPNTLADAARGGETVIDLGNESAAVILAAEDRGAARVALDQLRVSAWTQLGGSGPLPEVGLATWPADGAGAPELVAAARRRLERGREGPDGPREPAPVTPLYPLS